MINEKDRNAVRIIELPASKMVWSGVCSGSASTSKNKRLRLFSEWWSKQDKLRKDRFYNRDFMWWDEKEKGFAWGLAITDVPMDTGGFEVADFSGGLYAVANFADAEDDPHDAGRIYKLMKLWVENSGCFEIDASRNFLNHFISTPKAAEVMGYRQQDLYMPIYIKGGI